MATTKKAATKKPARPTKADGQIYQLKIELAELRPAIWRRFTVPGEIRLDHLHAVIQIVMGWTNSHLHEFQIGDNRCGMIVPGEDFGDDFADEREVRLNTLVTRAKQKFAYLYDFGDSWEHVVTVEKILPSAEGVRVPVCLAGEFNGPPEDCGGVGGFCDLMQAMSRPRSKEYREMVEWLGGVYDAMGFDLGAINRQLARLKVR
jgi:hypothetical protein